MIDYNHFIEMKAIEVNYIHWIAIHIFKAHVRSNQTINVEATTHSDSDYYHQSIFTIFYYFVLGLVMIGNFRHSKIALGILHAGHNIFIEMKAIKIN